MPNNIPKENKATESLPRNKSKLPTLLSKQSMNLINGKVGYMESVIWYAKKTI